MQMYSNVPVFDSTKLTVTTNSVRYNGAPMRVKLQDCSVTSVAHNGRSHRATLKATPLPEIQEAILTKISESSVLTSHFCGETRDDIEGRRVIVNERFHGNNNFNTPIVTLNSETRFFDSSSVAITIDDIPRRLGRSVVAVGFFVSIWSMSVRGVQRFGFTFNTQQLKIIEEAKPIVRVPANMDFNENNVSIRIGVAEVGAYGGLKIDYNNAQMYVELKNCKVVPNNNFNVTYNNQCNLRVLPDPADLDVLMCIQNAILDKIFDNPDSLERVYNNRFIVVDPVAHRESVMLGFSNNSTFTKPLLKFPRTNGAITTEFTNIDGVPYGVSVNHGDENYVYDFLPASSIVNVKFSVSFWVSPNVKVDGGYSFGFNFMVNKVDKISDPEIVECDL